MTNSVSKTQKSDKSGKLKSNAATASNLLNIDEAAAYTRRSRRTFQRELKQDYWTRIDSGGHPKFTTDELDRDLEAMTTYSRFRKNAGRGSR